MSFRDALKEAFAGIGGVNSENLSRVANAAREVEPDISPTYLRNLIDGQQPRPDHRLAIIYAFRSIHPRGKFGALETEDPNIARAIDLGTEEFTNPALVKAFVAFYQTISFRFEDGGGGDLQNVMREFRAVHQLVDEQSLFGLDDSND